MNGHRTPVTEPPEVRLEAPGLPAATVQYARRKVREVLRTTGQPVLHVRVRITRHGDPAVSSPVVAQANLDLNGRPLRTQVTAPGDLQAVDALVAALTRLIRHSAAHWEAIRARRYHPDPHEWRHGDPPAQRRPWYPRPATEREIVLRKTTAPSRCTVDEAAALMNDLDYDFYLFTEVGSGEDAVLYRAGPTGLRLAQVAPRPALVERGATAVTVSELPAPALSTAEAASRLELSGQPFVFYFDADHVQGRLLYHRYDGHYGLIAPRS